jgi:hypothetical protein
MLLSITSFLPSSPPRQVPHWYAIYSAHNMDQLAFLEAHACCRVSHLHIFFGMHVGWGFTMIPYIDYNHLVGDGLASLAPA